MTALPPDREPYDFDGCTLRDHLQYKFLPEAKFKTAFFAVTGKELAYFKKSDDPHPFGSVSLDAVDEVVDGIPGSSADESGFTLKTAGEPDMVFKVLPNEPPEVRRRCVRRIVALPPPRSLSPQRTRDR